MRSALVLTLLCHLCAAPALAGAWLREESTGFSATSFGVGYFYDLTQDTYLEYGLRPELTLGADISTFRSRWGLQSGAATLFLRFPLGTPTDRGRWAYELGAGATWIGEEVAPHVKATLSWGRGITLGDRGGWLAVDASVRWDFGLGTSQVKLDGTAGLDFTGQTTGVLQAFVTQTQTGTFTKIAPSIVFAPQGRKFRIQIGSEIPVSAPEDTMLKLGFWRSF